MQPQTPTLDFDDVNNAFIATPSPSLQSPLQTWATANKITNNRNNVSRNIMTVSGMNDPLLPSKGVTRYDVEGKGSPPVHLPLEQIQAMVKRVTTIMIAGVLSHHYAAVEATIVHTSLCVNTIYMCTKSVCTNLVS